MQRTCWITKRFTHLWFCINHLTKRCVGSCLNYLSTIYRKARARQHFWSNWGNSSGPLSGIPRTPSSNTADCSSNRALHSNAKSFLTFTNSLFLRFARDNAVQSRVKICCTSPLSLPHCLHERDCFILPLGASTNVCFALLLVLWKGSSNTPHELGPECSYSHSYVPQDVTVSLKCLETR